jgi:hypothetical protein
LRTADGVILGHTTPRKTWQRRQDNERRTDGTEDRRMPTYVTDSMDVADGAQRDGQLGPERGDDQAVEQAADLGGGQRGGLAVAGMVPGISGRGRRRGGEPVPALTRCQQPPGRAAAMWPARSRRLPPGQAGTRWVHETAST